MVKLSTDNLHTRFFFFLVTFKMYVISNSINISVPRRFCPLGYCLLDFDRLYDIQTSSFNTPTNFCWFLIYGPQVAKAILCHLYTTYRPLLKATKWIGPEVNVFLLIVFFAEYMSIYTQYMSEIRKLMLLWDCNYWLHIGLLGEPWYEIWPCVLKTWQKHDLKGVKCNLRKKCWELHKLRRIAVVFLSITENSHFVEVIIILWM